MAASLPGRTDNDIKNHWNCRLKKRSPKPTGTQSQGSNSTIEASRNKLPELNHFLPNKALKSESDGSMNILDLESEAQLSSSLCCQSKDENFGSESSGEDVIQSLQEQPLWVENSYCAENLQETFRSYCEMWCPEEFSPYGFLNDPTYDLSVNLSVPATDISELEEPCVLFE